jgi:uncharacterized membrane protein YeiB
MTAATSASRIVTLDVIRGIAVMGIFSVNVIAFAMIEAAYFNPPAMGGHTGANLATWFANFVLIDGKMRSLFSMLFGASALLVIDRAVAAGRSPTRSSGGATSFFYMPAPARSSFSSAIWRSRNSSPGRRSSSALAWR